MATTVTRLDGWYDEEHDGARPFRWIGREARCRITNVAGTGPLYLQIVVAQPLVREPGRLSVFANGRLAGDRAVTFHAARHVFPIEGSSEIDLTVSMDTVQHAPGDARALGAVIYSIETIDAGQLNEALHGEGWYEGDDEDYFASKWMGSEAQLLVPPGFWRRGRFAALPVCGHMEHGAQVLTLDCGATRIADLPLLAGWHVYDFELPAGLDDGVVVDLRVNRTQPAHLHPSDPRELGVRVGIPDVYDTKRQYEYCRQLHDLCVSIATGVPIRDNDQEPDAQDEQADRAFADRNAEINEREFESGATVLTSFAPTLGIDLYGKCNIKPPCVYCQWDVSKGLEGEEAAGVVDERTIEEYGPFFRGARVLLNCSIGEPLLHPRLPELLQVFARHGKMLEMITNGQAFTPATVRALAGRDITLPVSLDAACAATYGRLRNDRWSDVVAGLIALREARLHGHALPRLWIVFMPMRANLHDLEACFKLCLVVHASTLVLRPLIQLGRSSAAADRGGYHFHYADELLTRDEIAAVVAQAHGYGRTYGIAVHNEFGFGEERPTR